MSAHLTRLKIAEIECFIRKEAAKSAFLGHEYSRHYTVQKKTNTNTSKYLLPQNTNEYDRI